MLSKRIALDRALVVGVEEGGRQSRRGSSGSCTPGQGLGHPDVLGKGAEAL